MTFPNFLLIGPPRTGTTSLWYWLGEHPAVYMSPVKEACYFASELRPNRRDATTTREAYEHLFDGVTNETAIGEACPAYIGSRTAPDRIQAAIPTARLIATLRNPAERAYSQWKHAVQQDRNLGPADEALQPGKHPFRESLYAENLRRYFARFSRENVKVILFDDLVSRPDDVVRELFEFLQVDPHVKVRTVAYNESRAPRSHKANRLFWKMVRGGKQIVPFAIRRHIPVYQLQRPLLEKPKEMAPEIRQRLIEQYTEDVMATGELIGRDLSHWLA